MIGLGMKTDGHTGNMAAEPTRRKEDPIYRPQKESHHPQPSRREDNI